MICIQIKWVGASFRVGGFKYLTLESQEDFLPFLYSLPRAISPSTEEISRGK